MVGWLTLAMTLGTFLIVLIRYGFEISATPVREAVMYFHAIVILLGISYTLQVDEHVRVDLFYSRMSEQQKAVVNFCGHLLCLIPLCIVVIVATMPYVSGSWQTFESSAEVDGLPGIFLLKSLLPISASLLLIQALTYVIKQLLRWFTPRHA